MVVCYIFDKRSSTNFVFNIKDTHSEKARQKLNSSAYEKYEYGYLGRWHIKLTRFKRF